MTYSENNSTVLPGYMPTAEYFGTDSRFKAPGAAFIFGSQALILEKMPQIMVG